MSDNMKQANEFIRQLREQRDAYEVFAKERVAPLFTDGDQRERKPPGHFVNSSYLYARSFDGDDGSRPFSGKVFWLSPDMSVSPVSNLGAYTRTLNAGEFYAFNCTVRNRGDLTVPSAKVEFWLTDPSLGFDTRYARHLSLGNVPAGWVNPYSSANMSFTYMVPPTEAGHKCLFARIFSFSPLDLPVDDFRLDPTIDRHIAQLNLNIVGQGQPFQFNVIHAPQAELFVQFVPMAVEEVVSLRHPVMADVRPFRDIPQEGWTERTGVEAVDSDAGSIGFDRTHDRVFLRADDMEGADVGTQREVRRMVKDALAEINAGKSPTSAHRDLFAKQREINQAARRTTFKMQAPDLGLGRDQVVGVHVRMIDAGGQEEEALGGITLLVVGE